MPHGPFSPHLILAHEKGNPSNEKKSNEHFAIGTINGRM
jgi:hypothetical protein